MPDGGPEPIELDGTGPGHQRPVSVIQRRGDRVGRTTSSFVAGAVGGDDGEASIRRLRIDPDVSQLPEAPPSRPFGEHSKRFPPKALEQI